MLVINFILERRRYGSLSIKARDLSEDSNIQAGIEEILKEQALIYEIKYRNINETLDILYEIKNKKGINKIDDSIICEKIMSITGVSSVKLIKM